jgi:2-aminobenzoate-CoA ligase
MMTAEAAASSHVNTFARDNLPPASDCPEFPCTLPALMYPPRLNVAVELLDRWVAKGRGSRFCLIGSVESLSYAQTLERVNRIANVLVRDLGLVPGSRVLLRSANSPMLACAYLAVIKAGGVAVGTMPLLRARELAYPITKARIAIALCDAAISGELDKAAELAPDLMKIVTWGGGGGAGSIEALMRRPGYESFTACDTAADDVCLIAFTSGTTGEPKGTMHVHRNLLASCDSYGAEVLHAAAEDRFIGSPPLAFTFGLGGLLLFPLRVGAASVLLDKATPDDLLPAIARFRATVLFTAPTAYRAMLGKMKGATLGSLRKCVSAGEALPKATFNAWKAATGLPIMEGIGATEMFHMFIAAREEEVRAGSTGKVVPGYEARVIDMDGREVPRGTPGRLAVKGPTGCRYLADPRQRKYVENGWNITGDTYIQDGEGYFWYQARSDDMIVSAGYNIAGPEVEEVLLAHPAVAECGVVGAPDADRGQIVKAYVVLKAGTAGDAALARSLQEFVKATIAPYKYPREIRFVAALPRTQTGKLQRFELRRMALAEAAAPAGAPPS